MQSSEIKVLVACEESQAVCKAFRERQRNLCHEANLFMDKESSKPKDKRIEKAK